MTQNSGRRREDNEELPTIVSYRIGHLERVMENWESKLDDKLDDQGRQFNNKLTDFNEKLDDLIFSKGQMQLMDYRLKELEKWKGKFFAALTTITLGLVVLLLQEIFRRLP